MAAPMAARKAARVGRANVIQIANLSSEWRPKLETTNYTDSTSLFDLNKSSQVIGKSHELLSSTSWVNKDGQKLTINSRHAGMDQTCIAFTRDVLS